MTEFRRVLFRSGGIVIRRILVEMTLMRGSKLSGARGRRTPAYAPGKSKTGIFPNWLYLQLALLFAGTHFEPNVKRLSCGRWAALAFLHDPQDEANQARCHTRARLTQAV